MSAQITYFAVQEKEVESKEADTDLNVLDLDILPFAFAELLERHQFASYTVDGNGFCVQNEGLGRVLEAL